MLTRLIMMVDKINETNEQTVMEMENCKHTKIARNQNIVVTSKSEIEGDPLFPKSLMNSGDLKIVN